MGQGANKHNNTMVFIFTLFVFYVRYFRISTSIKQRWKRLKYGLITQNSGCFWTKILSCFCDSIGFASPFGAYRNAKALRSHRDNYGIAMRNLCYRKSAKTDFLPDYHFQNVTFCLSATYESMSIFHDFQANIRRFGSGSRFLSMIVNPFQQIKR